MLRMVPLPRFAGEDIGAAAGRDLILPRSRGVRRTGETVGSPRQGTTKWWRGPQTPQAASPSRASPGPPLPPKGVEERRYFFTAACAAASLAIGTRKGEQET